MPAAHIQIDMSNVWDEEKCHILMRTSLDIKLVLHSPWTLN
jgi:hypothetical protein